MTLTLSKYLDAKIHLRYRSKAYCLLELRHQWQMQKWMRILFPTAMVSDHFALRDAALEIAVELEEKWDQKLREQFEKTFGRKMHEDPYQWGIGYSEYPIEMQAELLGLSRLTSGFNRIALLHDLMVPIAERNTQAFLVNYLPKRIRHFILQRQIKKFSKQDSPELKN